jgi:hypothetical protein
VPLPTLYTLRRPAAELVEKIDVEAERRYRATCCRPVGGNVIAFRPRR